MVQEFEITFCDQQRIKNMTKTKNVFIKLSICRVCYIRCVVLECANNKYKI